MNDICETTTMMILDVADGCGGAEVLLRLLGVLLMTGVSVFAAVLSLEAFFTWREKRREQRRRDWCEGRFLPTKGRLERLLIEYLEKTRPDWRKLRLVCGEEAFQRVYDFNGAHEYQQKVLTRGYWLDIEFDPAEPEWRIEEVEEHA